MNTSSHVEEGQGRNSVGLITSDSQKKPGRPGGRAESPQDQWDPTGQLAVCSVAYQDGRPGKSMATAHPRTGNRPLVWGGNGLIHCGQSSLHAARRRPLRIGGF